MNLSEKMTKEKLQEILLDIYLKGNESKDIKVLDIIKEIKQKIVVES